MCPVVVIEVIPHIFSFCSSKGGDVLKFAIYSEKTCPLSFSAPVVTVPCLRRAEQLFDALKLNEGMLLQVIIHLDLLG